MSDTKISIIMMGASGAVGSQALKELMAFSTIEKLTLLGRTPIPNLSTQNVHQHKIDIFNPETYASFVEKHNKAICSLGVGQPSKISKEDFIKIDKKAVIDFATACKKSGVQHFQLLASVGINSKSSSFYLRAKGELVDELKALNFERLSIFQPSMILTPTNRYGFSQALTLAIWPIISPLLIGSLKKYRGIKVEKLGEAIAKNIFTEKSGLELLTWNDFNLLTES